MNDRPEVRRIFAEFNLEPVQTRYTVSNQFQTQASELLITNY